MARRFRRVLDKDATAYLTRNLSLHWTDQAPRPAQINQFGMERLGR